MKITEAHMQAVLMRWLLLEKRSEAILPNSNQFFAWEADLLSVTSSGLVHEFEIKISLPDYRRDNKKRKHLLMGTQASPAYFWYATFNFEIEPPANAGWILIERVDPKIEKNDGWKLTVKKEAPRLNLWKVDDRRQKSIARLLSWRVYHAYERQFLRSWKDEITESQEV